MTLDSSLLTSPSSSKTAHEKKSELLKVLAILLACSVPLVITRWSPQDVGVGGAGVRTSLAQTALLRRSGFGNAWVLGRYSLMPTAGPGI